MFYLSQHPPQHSTSTSTRKPLVWPQPYDLMTFTSQPGDPKGMWPRSCHPWWPKWLQPFWIWRPPLLEMEAWWRHDGAGERPRPSEIPVGVNRASCGWNLWAPMVNRPFLTLARCAEGVSSDLTRNQISDQASVYKMFGCSDLNRGNRNIVHHNKPTNVCFFPCLRQTKLKRGDQGMTHPRPRTLRTAAAKLLPPPAWSMVSPAFQES